MRTTSLFIASGLAALAAAAKIDLSSVKLTTSYQTVPGAYLVELDNLSSLGGKRSLDAHASFYSALKKRGLLFDIRKEFHGNDFFTGVSLNLHNDDDVKALADIKGIKSVVPVQILPRPAPVKSHVLSGPSDSAIPKDVFSTHKMTGVDKLHNEGHFGEGIKIGVIDTGIDYNHPSLGGGFGAGHKVAFGYDFVGDDYNGGNTPVPDNDPMDCNSHGTHVSGIIAADSNNPYNLTGVAPKATLGGYRVFGCTGGVGDDVLLDAMIKAYNDGCDVITMSLGGPAGWTESATAVVASRIAKSGRVVTIAAGNEGAYGAWYSSGPATGIDTIAVASIENTVVVVQNATVSDGHAPIPYFSFMPLKIDGAKEVYAVSTDTTKPNDACDPLPDSTPDLSDKLVVIRRGTCAFTQKLDNVAAKGAKQMLIYNNVPTALAGISVGNYTAALISDVDGAYLVNQFKAGKQVSLTFPQSGASFNYPSPEGGLVSEFSTYGPSNDMYFKAAVAAPGGNILSTYPVKLGSWAIESGTSMATPFVAGSAALILEAKGKGKKTSANMRTLLETTSMVVPSSYDDGAPIQTLSQAGAGLINVWNAIHYQSSVSPGELLLNDTAHFKGEHTIKITNSGNRAKVYTLTHVPAGTAITINNTFANDYPVPLNGKAATVTLSSSNITVAPGKTSSVSVQIAAPAGLDASTFPVYSGAVKVASDDGETLSVSYMGVAAALKDMHVIDNSDVTFGIPLPSLLGLDGNPQANASVYTFAKTNDTVDGPTLLYRLNAGTPRLAIDLVDSKINLKTTLKRSFEHDLQVEAHPVQKRDLFGVIWGLITAKTPTPASSTYDKIPTIGQIGLLTYQPRNSDATTVEDNGYATIAWDGTYANGTAAADGTYKVLVRALRITGKATNEKDYESWLSSEFTIKRS